MRETVSPDNFYLFVRVDGLRCCIVGKSKDAMLVQKAWRPVCVSSEEEKKRRMEDDQREKLCGCAGRKAVVLVILRRFHADWIQHTMRIDHEIVPVRDVKVVDGRHGAGDELVNLLNHLW